MSRLYAFAAVLGLLVAAPAALAQQADLAREHTVALGDRFSCAIDRPGTGVLCWGYNNYGQLGAGLADTMSTRPVAVQGLPAGVPVLTVRAGFEHACALLSGGGVMCWGRNQFGQLGDGTTTDRRTATAVWGFPGGAANGARALATGAYFSCVVRRDATAWCWGENAYGQLGDGTKIDRHTPYQVANLSGISTIEAGAASTFARITTGAVMAWGANNPGALGTGTPGHALTPVAVPALSSGVTHLAASGSRGGCAARNGTLLCWGENAYGRVGDGTTTDRDTPTPVSMPSRSAVETAATGYRHSCAVLSTFAVQCWGRGASGQLGSGTTADALTPVAMIGIPAAQAADVAVGSRHTCVRTFAGQMYCTGDNYRGELGDGTTAGRSTPVLVSGAFIEGHVTVASEAAQAPEAGAALTAPSPSPSHGLTRVTLTLAAPERVSARLLDVLGREVATVFDGTAAAGHTPLVLDVSGQAPGLYRLVVVGEASGLRLSRPIVVVR